MAAPGNMDFRPTDRFDPYSHIFNHLYLFHNSHRRADLFSSVICIPNNTPPFLTPRTPREDYPRSLRRTEQLFSVSSSFADLVAAFREMNLLPVDVQNSGEMRFARDVFLAYAGKNYLRFFRLLRSATYMQACLMHRYVACMHHHALSTLQAAYDPKEITLVWNL